MEKNFFLNILDSFCSGKSTKIVAFVKFSLPLRCENVLERTSFADYRLEIRGRNFPRNPAIPRFCLFTTLFEAEIANSGKKHSTSL